MVILISFICWPLLVLGQQPIESMANFANAAVAIGNAISQLSKMREELPTGSSTAKERRGEFLEFAAGAISGCQETEGLCCLFPNYCHPRATCQSTGMPDNWIGMIGALPSCECEEGFRGSGRNIEGGCLNVDECLDETAECEQLCKDYSPGYGCGCLEGYQLDEDDVHCVDIDECLNGANGCSHLCINTVPGFKCSCPSTHYLSDDNHTCIDVNECTGSHNPCDFQESCQNSDGGFRCACPKGWSLENEAACVDTDECVAVSCLGQGGQSCLNTPGGFECSCADGYRRVGAVRGLLTSSAHPALANGWSGLEYEEFYHELLGTWKGFDCEDVDECFEAQQGLREVCGGNVAICVNTEGSHACVCDAGFAFNEFSSSCDDVDECRNGNACSGKHEICHNTVGSFSCSCENGFERNHLGYCEDVDECVSLSPCQYRCINREPGYECLCPDGFYSDNGDCVDIDECQVDFCASSCLNLQGSYLCACDRGYTQSGRWGNYDTGALSQLPVNVQGEIRTWLQSMTIVDSSSPFLQQIRKEHETIRTEFSAHFGWSIGAECLDINECKVNGLACPEGLECNNQEGSYLCECPAGYKLTSGSQNIGRDPLLSDSYLGLLDLSSEEVGDLHPDVEFIENLAEVMGTEVHHLVQLEWNKYLDLQQSVLEGRELCTDVNECSGPDRICDNISPCCENSVGSFYCHRKRGIGRFAVCPPNSASF